MNTGARYGLFLGALCAAAWALGASAVALLLGVLAVQLITGAAMVWARMRLPYAAVANLIGGVVFGAAAVHVALNGLRYEVNLWTIVGALGVVCGPLMLGLEARRHPREWAAWREHLENASLLDMLTSRHIPVLRQ